MGVLQRVERRLEGLVGNTFARLFKGKVHPTEIGRALQREADEQRVVVGEGRVLVPNRYLVALGSTDYAHLTEWERELTRTLASMVVEHAEAEGWSTFGKVVVSFHCEPGLRTGVFEVRSEVDPDAGVLPLAAEPGSQPPVQPDSPPVPAASNGVAPEQVKRAVTYPPPPVPVVPEIEQAGSPPDDPPPALLPPPPLPPIREPVRTPAHVLVVDGPNTRYPLAEGRNVVGRGVGAQVRLPDTGVSRRHVDINVAGAAAIANDLGSTNGTIINGQRIAQHPLSDGDVIRIGHSVLVYRSDPQ